MFGLSHWNLRVMLPLQPTVPSPSQVEARLVEMLLLQQRRQHPSMGDLSSSESSDSQATQLSVVPAPSRVSPSQEPLGYVERLALTYLGYLSLVHQGAKSVFQAFLIRLTVSSDQATLLQSSEWPEPSSVTHLGGLSSLIIQDKSSAPSDQEGLSCD